LSIHQQPHDLLPLNACVHLIRQDGRIAGGGGSP